MPAFSVRLKFLALCVLGIPCAVLAATPEAELVVVPSEIGYEDAMPPERFVERVGASPHAALPRATEGAGAEIEALHAWNRSGRLPERNGFARPLPAPLRIWLTPAIDSRGRPGAKAAGKMPSGDLVWGAEVRVVDAYRLRLHLADLSLPQGTRLWVYGRDAEDFASFALDETRHEAWTPGVYGPTIWFELAVSPAALKRPGKAYGLAIDAVLESFPFRRRAEPRADDDRPFAGECLINDCFPDCPHGDCFEDAACAHPVPVEDSTIPLFAQLESEKRAIAFLQFPDGFCTGALVSTTPATFVPYLITANHCIPAGNLDVDVYFDFISATCRGSAARFFSLPMVHGARLVEAVPETDLALLRLDRLPRGRTMLGWGGIPNDGGVGDFDQLIHRLSHPCGFSQQFSVTFYGAKEPATCSEARPYFIYSSYLPLPLGVTDQGSSGAPAIVDRGAASMMIGQLLGDCPGAATCHEQVMGENVDGSLLEALPRIARYLAPASVPPAPRGLKATALKFSTDLYLSWQYSGSSPVTFVVEAKQGQSDFKEVARIPGLKFAYFQPAKRTRYQLRVLALNGNGFFSFPSNEVTVAGR